MDPILDTIDEALKRKGLSDAAASKLAVGNFAMIKNMRSNRSEDKRYNFQALEKLAEVLELECYFGPKRPQEPPAQVLIDHTNYSVVPLHDAVLSAGPGALNGDETVVGTLAFRSDWLRRQGISPGAAALARVTGDSMRPTLAPGDMLLINTSDAAREVPVRRARPGKGRPAIYALADGSEALVKRLIRPDQGTLVLLSDNADWLPDIRSGRALEGLRILGRVVWSGHTWDDKVDM